MHSILALIQEVVGSPGPYVVYGAGAVLMAALAWVLKTTRDVAATLERIEQYLFGLNGSNGLDAKVTEIREDVEYLLERRVGPSDRRRHE